VRGVVGKAWRELLVHWARETRRSATPESATSLVLAHNRRDGARGWVRPSVAHHEEETGLQRGALSGAGSGPWERTPTWRSSEYSFRRRPLAIMVPAIHKNRERYEHSSPPERSGFRSCARRALPILSERPAMSGATARARTCASCSSRRAVLLGTESARPHIER